MKKLFFASFMLLTLGLAASPVKDDLNVDPRVLSAFQKEFSFVKDAIWSTSGDVSQVRFSFNEQGFIAWYNSDAQLISTARNLLYMQLPLAVIKSLEEKYSQADFTSILEVTSNSETKYQIQAEEKKKIFSLEATPSGYITVVKKIKK